MISTVDIAQRALDRIGADCLTLAGDAIGGDSHSVWFVSWGDRPIEFKLRLRLTYRQWSLAAERGNLAEVREWLVTAETVLTKAIRATSPSLQAEHARFAAMASAWKEVTR